MGRKFKTENIIIALFCIINLILHLIADFNSGFHGDELLHIEAGNHAAFGYMDFPPLIAWLATVQNLFHSDSIFVNHLFVHISTVLIFLLCGWIVIELGGSWIAVLLTLSAILFAPGFVASHNLFLPVVFEQLTWIASIFLLVKYSNSQSGKHLIFLGIVAAIGFLAKYSIVFLIAGLIFSVLLFHFRLLKNKSLWIGLLLFLILILPNIFWQFKNGLPVFNHVSKLYETQLNIISVFAELKQLFLFLNPFTSVLWISGLLIVPFAIKFKKFRLTSFTLLFAFILLFLAKGKAYYYFPVVLGLLPLGALFIEQFLNRRRWILYGYLSLLGLSGAFLLPSGIPVLPLNTYLKLYHPQKGENDKITLPFENYYSAGIRNQILEKVNFTYTSLPEAERKTCLVWGRHYSQAGGINLHGKEQGLPQAFSFHSSFYNWVPEFSKDITVIVISDLSWDREHWLRYFDEVEPVCDIQNRFASDNEWSVQHIFLCRKLKYNSVELKQKFSTEIF